MKFLRGSVAAAVLFFSVVWAQSSAEDPSPSSTGTSSAAAATHTIKVGFPIAQHAFSPEETKAELGDVIVFEMLPANHSVVRMDPDSPCIPYDLAGHPSNELWWSGFYPVDKPINSKKFSIKVDTEDPIWFYCSAPGSCIDYQMVGVININKDKHTVKEVKATAAEADFSLSPGEQIPDESGNTPNSKASAAASNNDNKADEDDDGGSGLSGGAIAGIVIGAVAAFALVGLLFFFVGRRKKAVELKEKTDAETAAAQAAAEAHNAPPGYHDPTDPRYSMVPNSPNPHDSYYSTLKPGHQSLVPDQTGGSGYEERHPHRLSELPSQSYEPVEIYTPGLSSQMELPSPHGGENPQSPRSP